MQKLPNHKTVQVKIKTQMEMQMTILIVESLLLNSIVA